MSGKLFLVVALCAAIGLISTGLSVAAVYSENFDNPLYEELQEITSAPMSWEHSPTSDGVDGRIASGLHPDWIGKAIDMSTSIGYWGGVDYKNLSVNMTNTDHWVLSWDAWVTDDTFNTGMGLGSRNLAVAPNQPLVGFGYRASAAYLNPGELPNWYFDARFITGNSSNWIVMTDDGTFRNTTVKVEIHVDATTNSVWGIVSDYAGHSLNTGVLTTIEDRETYIGAVRLGIECYRGPDGMDIDNISVQAVPEPSALLALGTGMMGLLGFAVRRRK